ncbi:RNA polymerase sigma factor [Cohnella abietis]|uniref:RNA polymerase sigma factor n=1 Tax=Cohnella abietis TaxID=2507935 RepID=A0A3T1D7S1_9BACL|nr:sigma-70 family RNA polymerase sigma factor [Cohnella abietis]BBI34118.1 RNA polymerase sigma factor [Cohnella abietis]
MEYLKSVIVTDNNVNSIIADLMTAYGNDVWNYTFMMVKNRDAADDITQDVFYNAYRGLKGFEGRSSHRTWLLTIARHSSLNWLKSSFIKRVILVGFSFHKDTHRSAEQEVLEQMGIRSIWHSVMKLPAKQREVLVLDAHYELSYIEMAQLLKVSEGTVKSRLHRARAKMEIMLNDEKECLEYE